MVKIIIKFLLPVIFLISPIVTAQEVIYNHPELEDRLPEQTLLIDGELKG